MNIIKTFFNALFMTFTVLGIIVFILINTIENTQTRIHNGEQAQAAIQMLDEMRRPILAIENTFFLKIDQQSKYKQFKQHINKANIILEQYLNAATYDPDVIFLVKKLSKTLNNWIELEKKLWKDRLTLSKDTTVDINQTQLNQLQHQTIALSFKNTGLFFEVLDILAMGEKPIHNTINDGTRASSLFVLSGATLIVYLFIIIILFQKSKNKYLHDQQQILGKQVSERTIELKSANKELEAFAYSVSHDLRAPLRAIDGFSQALLEDYNEGLDNTAKDYLNRVRSATQKMAQLIDDMLLLSRVSRNQINKQKLNLTELAKKIIHDLKKADPDRKIEIKIADNLNAYGDKALINIALTNMLSNAWKYTANNTDAIIEFGKHDDKEELFIKDNGVGFDMQYANKLFNAFQRLHGSEFEGTGIGLATVKRILIRHNGDIRVEAKLNEGSCFYFSI